MKSNTLKMSYDRKINNHRMMETIMPFLRDGGIQHNLTDMMSGRYYLIVTDGSCIGNPSTRGGMGWVKQLYEGNQLIRQAVYAEQAPILEMTTNVRMEMTAALRAVEGVREGSTPAIILSDNELVSKGMNEWLPVWKANGWRASKGAVKNIDLWKELDATCEGKNIHWGWVKGHAGFDLNEMADTLANNAANGLYPRGRKSVQAKHPRWFINHAAALYS